MGYTQWIQSSLPQHPYRKYWHKKLFPWAQVLKQWEPSLQHLQSILILPTYLVPNCFFFHLLRVFSLPLSMSRIHNRDQIQSFMPGQLLPGSSLKHHFSIQIPLNKKYVNRKKLYYKYLAKSYWYFVWRFPMLHPYLAGYLRRFWM